ncbi:pentatricopeptide repeat-containing protein 2, mitochondrial-like isoform X2 [Arctopsyche grandis]
MKEFVNNDSTAMVFTDDLKNMVHLCEAEDVDLIGNMIKMFNEQNKEARFGNFVFGPVVMRMYHHFDNPDAALKIFEDSKACDFFDQLATYQILMDLLYKHGKYDQVRSVFDVLTEKQIRMVKYPKNAVILVMAACYKQNTKDSFEYASKLWSNLLSVGHNILRKSVSLFAGLALNQSAPHITLEALSTLSSQKYISVFNLKAAALADLNRLEDIIPILRSTLDADRPEMQNNGFTEDVIAKIQKNVEKGTLNKVMEKEFDLILKGLSQRKLILPTTLDALLCKEIKYFDTTDRSPLHTSFRNYRSTTHTQPHREGLKQMY